MTSILLTDADRFPLDAEDKAMVEEMGIACVEMAGHEASDLVEQARNVDAVLVYSAKMNSSVIGGLKRCRVLARCGVGFDNIDVTAARRRGIEVTYVPDYGSVDVAEHALALILACSRRLGQSDRAIRAGGWPGYADLGTMRRLSGQTLGLVGFGRISRCLAERADVLGLTLLAHDPLLSWEKIRDGGAIPATDRELLERSDIVSMHLPLSARTTRWLDAQRLSYMKPTAIIINTSRGAVVDEEALCSALSAGRLAGAGLDVQLKEPPTTTNPLTSLDNVILTPHSAAFTEEALADVRKTAIKDVLAVLNGEAPRHPVPNV